MNISKLNSRYKLLYQRDLQVDLSLTLENQSNQSKPVKRPTPSPEKVPEENNLDDNSKVSMKIFLASIYYKFKRSYWLLKVI